MVRTAALFVIVVALAGCANGKRSTTTTASTQTTATQVTTSSSTPACTTAGLAVWLGLGEGGGAAGSTYYPLEFTNVSGHACHLFGYPGVSARDGHQLGSPAGRSSAPEHTIVLAKSATAHAFMQITDVANFSPSTCAPVTAGELNVYPPNQLSAKPIPFSFRACSKTGPVFLSVQPVQPGVGIPGYPNL